MRIKSDGFMWPQKNGMHKNLLRQKGYITPQKNDRIGKQEYAFLDVSNLKPSEKTFWL